MVSLPAANYGSCRRPAFVRAAALAVVVCIAVLLLQQGRAEAASLPPFASVTASSLAVRQSASTRAKSLATVSRGDVVKVLSIYGSWYKVTTSSGVSGWCQRSYLAGSNTSSFRPSANALLDWPSSYINVAQTLTYKLCMQDMSNIAKAYSANARVVKIGTTLMGNPINAIVLGNPAAGTRLLVQASMHAREYISAVVALRQAETLLKAASLNASYNGVKAATILKNVEIWIVPMANPDGIRLATEGLNAVPSTMPALKTALKAMNGNSTDFTRWKANAHGVDLNRNFDAGWKRGSYNTKPGRENYPGASPISEPETVALRDLTLAKDFALTLSYHSSGAMIYWYDPGCDNLLNQTLAGDIKALTGYSVLSPASQGFSGGYRDWYVDQYHRPGMTVELGSGYCPLPLSVYPGIWQKNRFTLLRMAWDVMPKGLSGSIR